MIVITETVGADVTIGPDCTLRDVEVADGATVTRTHGELAEIRAGATVGPYVHLRPNATVAAGATVEAFTRLGAPTLGGGAAGAEGLRA